VLLKNKTKQNTELKVRQILVQAMTLLYDPEQCYTVEALSTTNLTATQSFILYITL